jgi:hypothetical protein
MVNELAEHRQAVLQQAAQDMAACSKQHIASYAVCVASDLLACLRDMAEAETAAELDKAGANESLIILNGLAKLLGITNSFVDDREIEHGETGHDQLSCR